MTNRLEKGQCLWCGTPLIVWEKALCSQCMKKYHAKAEQMMKDAKRGVPRKPGGIKIKGFKGLKYT